MKKTLILLILTVSSINLFSQAGTGSFASGFGGVLLTFLLISLGLFFILRSIMLWYWKINTIVKNQEDQNKLLKEQRDFLEQIYLLQGGHKIKYPTDSQEEINRKAKLFDQAQNK